MSCPPVALFPNTRNSEVRFENASIDIVGGNVINNQLAAPHGSELQQLLHYCLLSTLVDSKEQYDAPQCEPETRVAITQQIDDWAQNRNGNSGPLMWLRGGAGAGKSTLAQTIAMKYKKEGILVGSFFFSNRKANRSDGNALILTLVAQLIVIFPAIAPFIFQIIRENPTILSSSPEEHMKYLFVGPLNALNTLAPHPLNRLKPYLLRAGLVVIFILQSILGPILGELPYAYHLFCTSTTLSKPRPTLIVIDGLDECDDPKLQCRLLHVIATAIPQLPQSLRFLVASRPEVHIASAFERNTALSGLLIHQLDLSMDRDADEDIERYLRSRFTTIQQSHPFGACLPGGWPSNKVLLRLIEQSSGHFIYPSIVMAFVEDPSDFPQQRLEAVLDSTKHTTTNDPLGPLDALYRHMFSRVKENHLSATLSFFGLLCLENQRELVSRNEITGQTLRIPFDRWTVDKILQLEKGYLDIMTQPLRSLVDIPAYPQPYKSDERPMRCFHASLFDFLLNPARSGRFYINLGLAHEAVAIHFTRHVFKEDTENVFHVFEAFVHHCSVAVLSDDCLRSYLRTCDYLYQQVFRHDCVTDTRRLCASVLHLVSRKNIDPDGQLRLGHLKKMEQALPECDTEILETCQSGDPISSTNRVLEQVQQLNVKVDRNKKYDPIVNPICSILAYWYPNAELAHQDVHPDRDIICQRERAIFTSSYTSPATICTIRCGSLLHMVAWDSENVSLLTYDAMGRSFQTIKQDLHNSKLTAMNHIKKCDALLRMGENAPWSVSLDRWPAPPSSEHSWTP